MMKDFAKIVNSFYLLTVFTKYFIGDNSQVPKYFLKILSRANCLIANNNIRSDILEIKKDRCKLVKIEIFYSLSENIFTLKMFLGKRTKY